VADKIFKSAVNTICACEASGFGEKDNVEKMFSSAIVANDP
jgi:hypothetical protein